MSFLAGLVDFGMNMIPGVASAMGAAEQRRWEAKQAQKQMDFQERMSDTQWQRGVADMKAAGINPMLSFSQGGASSPVGAMTGSGPNIAQSGVSTAMDVARGRKELALLEEQKKTQKAVSDKTFWEGQKAAAEMSLPDAIQDGKGSALPRTYFGLLRQAQMDQMAAYAASARASAAIDQQEARIRQRDAEQETSRFGRGLNWVRRFRESVFGGSNPAAAAGHAAGAAASLGGVP